MAGLYTHTTRADGLILSADIYNADHQNHIDNLVPAMIDDYSTSTAQMQTQTDPGETGSESLATSLAGELERIRYRLAEISGMALWNQTGSGIRAQSLATASLPTAATAGRLAYQNDGARGLYVDQSGKWTPVAPFVNAHLYGVKGDGTTNDTSAINTAITAVAAAGGGVLFFPPGTYMINTTINLAASVILQGAGKTATTIKLLSGTAANTQMVTGSSIARCGLRDLTLDGNRAVNSAVTGLSGVRWETVTWSFLDHIRVTGVTLHGVDASTANSDNSVTFCDFDDYGTAASGFGVVFLNNCQRNRIIGCRAKNTLQGVGFAIDDRSGGTGPNASNHNIIANCTTEGGDYGIQVQGSSFNVVEGNTIYRPTNYGIQCSSGSDVVGATDAQHNVVRGNTIEIQTGVNANGIQVTGLYCIVEGNNVRDGQEGIIVSDVTNATSDTEYITIRGNTLVSQSARGIYVAGGRRVLIEGNQVIESGSSGIEVAPDTADSAINNVLIQGNIVAKAGAHGIHLKSTASLGVNYVQVINNHIYDPSQGGAATYSGVMLTKGAAALNRVDITGNKVTQVGATAPKQTIEYSGTPTEVMHFDNRNWGFTDNTFYQGVLPYFQSAGGLEFQEMSSGASAPAANRAYLYAVDNGAGKTLLQVRFGSGAAQTIATEP